MAATTRSSKKSSTKKVVEEVPKKVEENLEVASSSDDDSFEQEESADELASDIEGLSEDEGEKSTHNIKKLKAKKQDASNKKVDNDQYSSIIYVSRLPQGFHEKELSKYFSQFGDLKEVRLARNKKSGNSRHYGFIEFVNKDDAKVAQETMNNYLLMGHLLQVRLMGKGTKIEKLFKYRKRAFIETPVKKTAKELIKTAAAKQEERMAKLADAGMDFKW